MANEFSANMSKDHAVAMATAKFSEGVRRVVAVESTQTDQAWELVLRRFTSVIFADSFGGSLFFLGGGLESRWNVNIVCFLMFFN